MAKGVYRRPHVRPRRRFVPHTFAASHVVVLRRRLVARRRWLQHRRMAVVLTFAASGVAPIRRPAHVRRPTGLRRKTMVVGSRSQVGQVIVRAVRRLALKRRGAYRRRFLPGGLFTPVPGVSGPSKLWKAIHRIRRAMQARLRWKPRPEPIPPEIQVDYIEQSMKGRISSSGLMRGRLFQGGD